MNGNRIFKNSILNTIKSISTLLFPIITFPYIARVLGASSLGRVNYGRSIVSYIELVAALGISTYAVRECSRVKDNKTELEKVASQLLSINIISSIISYIILFVLLVFAKPLYEYRSLILIQSVVVLFTTFGADWINTALEDFKYITVRTFAFQLLALILTLLFIKGPDDYFLYAIITVCASSGGNICNIIYRRKYCKTKFTLNMGLSKHLPSICTMFAMLLSQSIFTSLDTTIIGLFRGDYEVGLYSNAMKIYHMVNVMIASIVHVVMPQLTKAYNNHDNDSINRILRYAFSFIAILGIPCIIGMSILSQDIVIIVGGNEYAESATSLQLLTVALAFSLAAGFIGNIIFLSSGRERYCLRASLIAGIINGIANVIFVPKYGFNAAALTTVLAEIVTLVILFSYLGSEIRGLGFRNLVRGPLIGGGCVLIICLLLKNMINNIYMKVLIIVVISSAVYFCVLYLTKNEYVVSAVDSVKRRIVKHT